MKRLLYLGLLAPVLLWRLIAAFREPPLAIVARHPWMALGVAGLLLAIGGLTVAASGIIGVTASAGHWTVTERFLQFSKRRSVVTHALRITAPPLDDQSLVLRGATQFDLGCRPCHGATTGEIPQVVGRMLPPPPDLNVRVRLWHPRELFYIVKHGIKMTGMPAWPVQQRDDEVWAMVAFLRRLPEMSASQYQGLARGESLQPFDLGTEVASPPEVVTETCARCHGFDGNGRGAGAFPKLAGQRAEYLDGALRAYAEGRRHSGVMGPISAALSAETRRYAADYYAALPAPHGADVDRPRVIRGQSIAVRGNPEQMIPACSECHGPPTAAKNPAYPILDGQYEQYLVLQLRLLRDRHRGGSEYVHLMHSFIDRLSDDQIQDAAAYFASRR